MKKLNKDEIMKELDERKKEMDRLSEGKFKVDWPEEHTERLQKIEDECEELREELRKLK